MKNELTEKQVADAAFAQQSLEIADGVAYDMASKIDSMQADMLKARSILLRWCNDGMNDAQINQLERETLEFCRVQPCANPA